MRYAVASTLAIAAAVSALPQNKAPQEDAPAGCSPSYDGEFQIQVVNVTSSASKRSFQKRQMDGSLMITLQDGVLTDNQDRIGSIVANSQFQFDNPVQSDAQYTAGWSVCQNGSLAIGNDAVFYQCLSGTFYNLYDENQAAQCTPVYINVIGAGSAASASGAASTIADGQVTGSAVASTIGDGQIQASSAAEISQISDGQIQATTSAAPVTQISDGQIQATTAPVTQISDGQLQAPTSAASPVTQIGDGQIQAPSAGNMTMAPSGTGVGSAPSGTGSPIASYTGAASKASAAGVGLLAALGLVAAL